MPTTTDNVITELGTHLMGFQEFETTADPSSALAQAYTFKLTLNGTAFNSGNDITVTLTAGEALASIATKIQTAINTIVATSVTVAVNSVTGKIRITSVNTTQQTSKVSLSAPTAGSSLLTLLGGVGSAILMPVIARQKDVIETKLFPIVKIESTGFRPMKKLSNTKAGIRTADFIIRVYAETDVIAQVLVNTIWDTINSKSISGGWWIVDSDYLDRGESTTLLTCIAVACHETLWQARSNSLYSSI